MSDVKFQQIKEAIQSLVPLTEAASKSLSRTLAHTKNRNVALISANRQENSPEENNKAHENLKKDIKAHGLGYIHVKGTYPEKQNDGSTKQGQERSFLITSDPKHKEKHHKVMMKLGAKYNQDSIGFKAHDEGDFHLHTTTNRGEHDSPVGHKSSVGPFHPGRMGDYMTKLKGKRSFVFESAEIEWHDGWLAEMGKAKGIR